jgi:hypothetical protein
MKSRLSESGPLNEEPHRLISREVLRGERPPGLRERQGGDAIRKFPLYT